MVVKFLPHFKNFGEILEFSQKVFKEIKRSFCRDDETRRCGDDHRKGEGKSFRRRGEEDRMRCAGEKSKRGSSHKRFFRGCIALTSLR